MTEGKNEKNLQYSIKGTGIGEGKKEKRKNVVKWNILHYVGVYHRRKDYMN